MKCPYCKTGLSKVLKSELLPNGHERERIHQCQSCGKAWRTTEQIDPEYIGQRSRAS